MRSTNILLKLHVLLIYLICSAAASSQTKIGDNLFLYSNPPPSENCAHDISFDPAIHENASMMLEGSSAMFDWPLSLPLNSGSILVNYVDNLSGGGIKDYEGNEWAYNGHRGTDICLHDFRSMDRTRPVVAGESGRVIQIAFTNPDRNTSWDGSPANIVGIRHDDGSYAFYYHLMRNSVLPKVGEYVLRGRTIGFVGSSGNSTDAHLHFEPGYFVDDTWNRRDPWNGSYNTLPTMWRNQNPYVGDVAFNVHDMGVYVNASVGGDVLTNTDFAKLKERIIAPVTVSGYEPRIGVWVQFQGNYTNNSARIEIRKPNGEEFLTSNSFYLNSPNQYSWTWWTPVFNPGIDVTGNWYARIIYNGVEQMRTYFNVQLLTSTRPRLHPTAAKCFRKSLFVQRDTLRVRPVRTNMQYDLLGAPSNVTLTNDSIINIGTNFTQSYRLQEFKVIASIGGNSNLRDTMIYKLIDTTKPNPVGNGISSLELKTYLEGRFNGSTMIGDTVTVQLRTSVWPYFVVDSDKFLLNSSGFGIANFLNATQGGNYYIVVKHRSSIETWSKTIQTFQTGVPLSYDFTTAASKAYGDNLKFKNFRYCNYSGDVNQDGIIDGSDIYLVENDISFFLSGYTLHDIDGDQFVDAADVAIVDNNAYNFVVRIRP